MPNFKPILSLLAIGLQLTQSACSNGIDADPQTAKNAYENGDFQLAKIQYSQLEHDHSDGSAYSLYRALVLIELNDPWGARGALENARKRGADKNRVNLLMAEVLLKLDKFKEAQLLLDKLPASFKAQKLRLSAEIEERQGSVNQAHDNYLKALELAPEDGRIMMGMARTFLQRGQYERAFEIASKAEKTKPYRIGATLLTGVSRLHQHRIEDALQRFDFALDREPGNWFAMLYKTDMLDLLERYDEMNTMIGQLEKRSAKDPAVMALKGKYAVSQKNWSDAHRYFQASGRYINNDSRAQLMAARAAVNQGLSAAAYRHYERAIELRPDLYEYSLEYAEYLFKNDLDRDALQALDRIRVAAPGQDFSKMINSSEVVLIDRPEAAIIRQKITSQ